MPLVLARYLTGIFLGRAAMVLLGLAALLQLLDLLDKAGDVLARGGVWDIGRYALLRLPSTLGQLVPLAVLVGAILTFRRLAASLEITAMRASGIGMGRVMVALAPACLLAGLLQLGLQSGLAPRTERALSDWWNHREVQDQPLALRRRMWLRSGPDILAADAVSPDGTALSGVLLVRRDTIGRVALRIAAEEARHGAEGWRLTGARVLHLGAAREVASPDVTWPEGPSPDAMRSLARPSEAQGLQDLLRGERGEGPVTRGPAYFATRLHAVAAAALAPFLMLLLAAPSAFGLPRQRGGGWRAAVGLALGLGYLVAQGLFLAIGEAGGFGPLPAAWSMLPCFAIAGLLRLWREEA
ncbi:LptF/LptG family permease [Roseomonas populi]|uniref:LptF/LptG family permease n=1 Tax=Roseomonas populi TaxID=3121582 RepID=A0ABT1WZ05_9PROT|nr:LptF/LptG family permease [Roseomonas pecuniae]MCR0981085.1 LptF/LptG family permease [Roseomonas pecuniae]